MPLFLRANMRDIYVWFSIIYFLAGAIHLYQQYVIIQLLKQVVLR